MKLMQTLSVCAVAAASLVLAAPTPAHHAKLDHSTQPERLRPRQTADVLEARTGWGSLRLLLGKSKSAPSTPDLTSSLTPTTSLSEPLRSTSSLRGNGKEAMELLSPPTTPRRPPGSTGSSSKSVSRAASLLASSSPRLNGASESARFGSVRSLNSPKDKTYKRSKSLLRFASFKKMEPSTPKPRPSPREQRRQKAKEAFAEPLANLHVMDLLNQWVIREGYAGGVRVPTKEEGVGGGGLLLE